MWGCLLVLLFTFCMVEFRRGLSQSWKFNEFMDKICLEIFECSRRNATIWLKVWTHIILQMYVEKHWWTWDHFTLQREWWYRDVYSRADLSLEDAYEHMQIALVCWRTAFASLSESRAIVNVRDWASFFVSWSGNDKLHKRRRIMAAAGIIVANICDEKSTVFMEAFLIFDLHSYSVASTNHRQRHLFWYWMSGAKLLVKFTSVLNPMYSAAWAWMWNGSLFPLDWLCLADAIPCCVLQ